MSNTYPQPPVNLQRTPNSSFKQLATDQRRVAGAYFSGPGVTLTPAGSGTGKTTAAIEIFGEAIFEELKHNEGDNPFKRILSTSFSVDAARQLKTKVKQRCRDHIDAVEANGHTENDPICKHWEEIQFWIETDSHIQTLDSFAQECLREVADEMELNPAFEVASGPEYVELVDGILVQLQHDARYAPLIATLEAAFPSGKYTDSWGVMIANVQQKAREFGKSPQEAAKSIQENMYGLFNGKQPTTVSDIVDFSSQYLDSQYESLDFEKVIQQNASNWVEYAQALYQHSTDLANAFATVLEAYCIRYENCTNAKALYTHTDITYLLWQYLDNSQFETPFRDLYRKSLENRFRHILVDEVQDTSYTQMKVLSNLIPEEPDDTHMLCIGDLKQSIYGWRSADPTLFSDLILSARNGHSNSLRVQSGYLRVHELTENFRSEPNLVASQNHIFTNLFSKTSDGRHQIDTLDIAYEPLEARRQPNPVDDTTIHTFDMSDVDLTWSGSDRKWLTNGRRESQRDTWMRIEANRVAARLQDILINNPLFIDEDRHLATGNTELTGASQMRKTRPGDFAALFRSKSKMNVYSQALSKYGIKHARIGGEPLLDQPEVELLRRALRWMSHPSSPRHLSDLVTSPLSPIGDDALERLAANHFDLRATLSTLPPSFPVKQREQLIELQTLTEEIGWERNRRKSRVLRKVIRRTGLDAVVLSDQEGLQRYANIREFIAIIDGWEENRVISFTDCLNRVSLLESEYVEESAPMATIADMESDDTVKLLSIHASKGLEFPVVIMADTFNSSIYQYVRDERIVMKRGIGFALRPYAGGAQQPDIEEFRNRFRVNGLYDEFNDGDHSSEFNRGLLWLSEERGRNGGLLHEPPFEDYVKSNRSEDWRCYYVSYTRASDHLIFPRLGERSSNSHRKWNTYVVANSEYLKLQGGNIEDVPGFNIHARTIDPKLEDIKNVQRKIVLGIDDLHEAPPPVTHQQAPRTLLANVQHVLSPPTQPNRFHLRTITPSSLQTVWLATRDYQLNILQGIDTGNTGTRSGSAPPSVAANIWGEIVHDCIEHINEELYDPADISSPDPALLNATNNIVESHLDGVARRIIATSQSELRQIAIGNYVQTRTYENIREATQVFTEFPMLSAVNGAILFFIDGRVDILYRAQDGGWILVDIKTGKPVRPGTELYEQYEWQLNVYTWMLEQVYDIQITEARLVYVYPELKEETITLNRSRTMRRLTDLTNRFIIDDSGALSFGP